MSLVAELKRRNVFKVGAAYLGLGWIVTQVTGAVVPALNLPNSLNAIVVWRGIAGFPFVLASAWIYELTPEGLKRESEIDRASWITQHTGRKLDYLIVGLLIVAIAITALDRMMPRPVQEGQAAPRVTAAIAANPASPALTHPARTGHWPAKTPLTVGFRADAPSGHSAEHGSGATCSRCARIFAITSASSMLAMILSCPPQRAQASISMPNRSITLTSPPQRREDTALKFFFTVPSLSEARATAASLGGEVFTKNWSGLGFIVCNAMDPEGNVFQVRENAA